MMKDLTNQKIKGYELIACIGTGGFGAVYRAYQDAIGREVAVKIILPEFANQPDFIRRFETEAQVIARLEHPYIVPLYDYWRDPTGAYLVMRYLRGGSLRDALSKNKFTPQAIAGVLEQVAGALSLAHRNDIIHRDIKPGNILLDEDGNTYLTDFGIAKDLTQHHGSITKADAIVGSLDYMSPEQARSEPVTSRTDIYSLGVVLYELLTGSHPFHEVSSVEQLYKHINDPLPTIDSIDPSISESINNIIQKATAKNPDQRYQDVLEMMSSYREAVYDERNGSQEFDAVALLTPREQEVLSLLVKGLSNRDIAERLVITLGTVKWYITQIYRKLQVRGRVQAIVRARELDLIVNGHSGEQVQPVSTDASLTELDNPYKGLEAFAPADSQDYYGREELIETLLARMSEDGPFGRFLAVVGPSGSGKSSLVKAGLIPALWCGGLPDSESWFLADMLPGSRPLDELEVALTRFASSEAAGVLGEHLRRDENGLVRAGQLILPDDGSELVVIVDQFEELFTLVNDEAMRTQFLNLLQAAVTDRRSRVRVVITLRADFYDRPLHYPEFGEMVRNRMETILPLSSGGLERAIVKPAERVGVIYEEGLVTRIVSEMTYQPGALPLVQYCLTELFERREGRCLTYKAYYEMGGAVGALARRAEDVFNSLDDTGQGLVRQMFLRLVTLGAGTEDTRRRVMQQELVSLTDQHEVMEELIDLFASYRLLSLDHDTATRHPTVEVAHEAILREWERLKGWLNDSRQDIRLHRKLMQSVAEWQQANRDRSYLLQGARLDEFQQWCSTTTVVLTPVEREYLNMCSLERQRRIEQEQLRQAREARLEHRSRRALQVLVVLLLFVAVGSGGVTVFAVNERNRTNDALTVAEREANVNHSLVLASNARGVYSSGNVDLALLLGLEAVAIESPPSESIQTLTEVALGLGTRMILDDYPDEVRAVSFSPDGETLLTATCVQRATDSEACAAGQLILRDVASRRVPQTVTGHTGWINRVAYNNVNPSQIVTASDDGTLIVWDVEEMSVIHVLEGHTAEVNDAVFVNEGTQILSASADARLILWDVETGKMLHRFEGHAGPVNTVDVSPDGLSAISASDDSTIMFWNIDRDSSEFGSVIQRYEGHAGPVYFARFVPRDGDNSTVLSYGDDLIFILWEADTGTMLRAYGIGAVAGALAVSPDSHTAIYSIANIVQVWDIDQWGQAEQPLYGHMGTVLDIDISPDGLVAATASVDGTVRLWNIAGQAEMWRYEVGSPVAAIATDGQHLLIGATQTHWLDIETEEVLQTLVDEQGPAPDGIALSADSRYALITHADHDKPLGSDSAKIWDLQTGEVVTVFDGNLQHARSVALSPDGRLALTGSQDYGDGPSGVWGDLVLWDAQTGAVIRRFDTVYDAADMRFNADASRTLTCSAVTPTPHVQLWDVASGELIREWSDFPEGTLGILDCIFGPDETTILTSAVNGSITLWDIDTGARLRDFVGHTSLVWSLDLSPNGHYVVSGSADNTIILWDYATGEIVRRFEGHQGWVFDVAFHPDGNSVFSVSGDDTVRQWRVGEWSLDEVLTWVDENRYVRNLTCEELATYRIEPLCDESSE